jgi:hypothetical protein
MLEADWNSRILREIRHPDHHHHCILLRNGNVLLHCLGGVPDDIARRIVGGAPEHSLPSAPYSPAPA